MKKIKSLISFIMPARLAHAETLDAINKLEEKAIVKLTNDVKEKILLAIKNGKFETIYSVYYTDYSDVKMTKRVYDTVIETFLSRGYSCEFTFEGNSTRYGKIHIKWDLEEHK